MLEGLLQMATLGGGAGLGLLALGALAAVAVGAIATALAMRVRRYHRELRQVVNSIEEIRAGRPRGRPAVGGDSSLSGVADAVYRLGHDLHSRWTEADVAAERWRALTAATHNTAIITTDNDGDVRSFSSGAVSLFGWEEEEVVSHAVSLIFEESAYKDLLPKLTRRTLRRQGITARSKLCRRDGSSFPAEVAVRMLQGEQDEPLGFMLVVRDLSEQQQLEDDLRESEQRYRGLVEGLSEGVLIVRDGLVVYANAAAEAICGKPAAEMNGRPWRERVGATDVLVFEEALAAVESGRAPAATVSGTLVAADASRTIDVRVAVSPVEFAGGPATLLLVQDQSAERRMASELQRNEARLDAVIEATTDGILVLSGERDSSVEMTNAAFAGMFELTTGELLGMRVSELVRMLERGPKGSREIAAHIAGRGPASIQARVGENDAERRIDVHSKPLLSQLEEPLGRIVVCRDVTEHHRSRRNLQAQAEKLQLSKVELEQSYRHLNDANTRLGERGEELDRLNRELRRLDEMKSDLLGNVSHELQTPLVSIRGYTEMILKERLGPITEEQRKGLALALKNIDRMISMIDNLLAFARTDPSDRELELTDFGLRALVAESVDLLREKIEAKKIDVRSEFVGADIELHADRNRILQVFVNLLSNAVKFTPANGMIVIVAEPGPEGSATIRVRDNGIGIPEEALGRIFERHFQVRAGDAPPGEGSGIGLAIVRDVLRLHGCTISVRSEEGMGAEFSFTLPMRGGKSTTDPGTEAPSRPQPDERPSISPRAEDSVRRVPRTDTGPVDPRDRPRLRIIRRDRGES